MADKTDYTPVSPLWSNPLAKGLMVGKGRRGVVWMPSAYDAKKRYPFRPLQIRFLHAIAAGEDLNDACAKLELTVEEAFKLLQRKKCKEYLAELESMDAETVARTAKDRVAHELLDVWDGKTQKTREQLEAGKELWARVWPKPEKAGGGHGDKLEININVGKIEQAFARQEAINAEIISEEKP